MIKGKLNKTVLLIMETLLKVWTKNGILRTVISASEAKGQLQRYQMYYSRQINSINFLSEKYLFQFHSVLEGLLKTRFKTKTRFT